MQKQLGTLGFDGYQHELEVRALEFLEHPSVQEARHRGAALLSNSLSAVDPASAAQLDASSEEITFLAVMNALNHDCDDPQVHYVETLPYSYRGRAIPGSRGLDDNPDTVYRIIPVASTSVFKFSGKVHKHAPIVNDFSLLSKEWNTLDNLDKSRLVRDSGGNFEITLSPEPANGRPNHLRTGAGADYLMVRDTLADWEHQRANTLSVTRVGGPVGASKPDKDALLRSAITYTDVWFKETVRLHNIGLKYAANDLMQPQIRSDHGMLVTQAYSVGHFEVAEDKALVITMHPGGAKYLTVPITNLWGLSADPERCTSTLNSSQAKPNPDGTFTYVLSTRDPGIHNWVDSNGLSRGFLFLRWAAIEPTADSKVPAVDSKLVAFEDLDTHLPKTAVRVDRSQRAEQLRRRAQHFNNRFKAAGA